MTDLDLTPYLAQTEGQYFDRKSLFDGRPGAKAPADRRKVRDIVARWVADFANAPTEVPDPASTWLASELREGGSVSNARLRKALGLDRSAAKRLLRDWSERGLIEVEGERRAARWVRGPAFARWSRLVLGGAKP